MHRAGGKAACTGRVARRPEPLRGGGVQPPHAAAFKMCRGRAVQRCHFSKAKAEADPSSEEEEDEEAAAAAAAAAAKAAAKAEADLQLGSGNG